MKILTFLKWAALGGTCTISFAAAALAENFDIPGGDLHSALKAYSTQSGIAVIVSDEAIKGARTKGIRGDLSAEDALTKILYGTGFTTNRDPSGVVEIVRNRSAIDDTTMSTHVAVAAAPSISGAALETVTVTSSKVGGDIQNIPISITALSQEQLTATQTAGGPDLVKQVPNLTFSKTNFSGYNIQIRGIGTQAISVTTDPAVAVALNDIPFIRNHFFEQEFYDLSQAEVLRGPQGTLYGRNATAGVVNIVTAKPSDQFEAMVSADFGNYQNRRFEGMINVPIIDDRLDVRVAGEWTKRQGYSFNTLTNSPIDGRDLWSGRVTFAWKPLETVHATLVWEHFSEDDDRMRTAKQLCKYAPDPTNVDGVPLIDYGVGPGDFQNPANYLSQGCLPSSLYSADAFGVPNGLTLPYITAAKAAGEIGGPADPYSSTTQSQNLRVIESALNPQYKAKNDVVELNSDYDVTPMLKLTSQTGFNQDFLWSTEDYNRFNTAPGLFGTDAGGRRDSILAGGFFCDPQLGCANRLVAEDLSDEHAWQLSQEFRLASNFSGPFNFSVGGNYLHYETEENYYVFINVLTLYTLASDDPSPYVPGVTDNRACIGDFEYTDPNSGSEPLVNQCNYIDPNPIQHLNNNGHNYFLSQNPYELSSYAGFGEVYYNVLSDLKLTGGARWTDDQKHFTNIPSEVARNGWGYPSTGVVDQQWKEWTGRFAANWTPKLDFTDQTLFYGSYAHGYKAGGANPPGAALLTLEDSDVTLPQHPLTFKPEFIDAFELGTKNTLSDGAITFNGDVFYYDYKGYQISEIVDRTSINLNFDATVKGAELETSWEPTPGLKFRFTGGYEDARLANGSKAIDLIDRTAGNTAWMVVKPSVVQASNCILPVYVVAALIPIFSNEETSSALTRACGTAYVLHEDPGGGFDPVSPTATNNGAGPAPNNGEGFDKNLSGNQLPNAPHFTTSLSADYTLPLSADWVGTLHSDFYWQASSFARIFNDRPYDQIHGYTTVNFALIFTNQNGWQAMGYLKNAFNTTAITGDFLNSDDTGLTTNVFLTDPRLYGVRITKNF